jgi:DNA-binding MarR family transcriptional regulator
MKQTITMTKAAQQVTASFKVLEGAFKTHNRGTLRRYLWAIASGFTTYDVLGKELCLTASQTSRAARTLHKMNYDGAEGLDLVNITFDLANPRIKIITLNRAGRALLVAEFKALTGLAIED